MEYRIVTNDDYLAHHGVKGMKWGVRRYQNADGTLTAAGKKRYNDDGSRKTRGQRKYEDYQRRLTSFTKAEDKNIEKLIRAKVDEKKVTNKEGKITYRDLLKINDAQERQTKAQDDLVRLRKGNFAGKLAKETQKRYGKADDFTKVEDKDLYKSRKTGKTITGQQMMLLRDKRLEDAQKQAAAGAAAASAVIFVLGSLALAGLENK